MKQVWIIRKLGLPGNTKPWVLLAPRREGIGKFFEYATHQEALDVALKEIKQIKRQGPISREMRNLMGWQQ